LYKHDAFTKRKKSFSNFFIPLAAFALLAMIIEPQAIPITLTLVFATYLDHRQSLIIACLLGMWIPVRARNVIDARIWAFGGFLLLEIATYALTLTAALAILPGLLRPLISIEIVRDITIGLLSMALFYGLLELIISRLWQSLNEQLVMDDAQRRLQIQITDWL